jgi:predicted acyl esterase
MVHRLGRGRGPQLRRVDRDGNREPEAAASEGGHSLLSGGSLAGGDPLHARLLSSFFTWWWTLVRRRILDESKTLDIESIIRLLPVAAMGEALDAAGPGWQELVEHDTLDELWRSRRWDGEYDFDVPCLHVTGWHDREDIQGAFHHYEQMIATSPAPDRQWLLVGPWSHTSTYWPTDEYTGIAAPGSALDTLAITLRFFDHFLNEHALDAQAEPAPLRAPRGLHPDVQPGEPA